MIGLLEDVGGVKEAWGVTSRGGREGVAERVEVVLRAEGLGQVGELGGEMDDHYCWCGGDEICELPSYRYRGKWCD